MIKPSVMWIALASSYQHDGMIALGPVQTKQEVVDIIRHVEVHEGWLALPMKLRPGVLVEQALAEAEADAPKDAGACGCTEGCGHDWVDDFLGT